MKQKVSRLSVVMEMGGAFLDSRVSVSENTAGMFHLVSVGSCDSKSLLEISQTEPKVESGFFFSITLIKYLLGG